MSAICAKRYKVVFLCTHARGPHPSYSAAAKVLKKSKHFVQMWVERYRDTKTVDDRGSHGKTLGMAYGKCWSRLVQCIFFGRSVLLGMGSHKTSLVSRWWSFLQRTVKHPPSRGQRPQTSQSPLHVLESGK